MSTSPRSVPSLVGALNARSKREEYSRTLDHFFICAWALKKKTAKIPGTSLDILISSIDIEAGRSDDSKHESTQLTSALIAIRNIFFLKLLFYFEAPVTSSFTSALVSRRGKTYLRRHIHRLV